MELTKKKLDAPWFLLCYAGVFMLLYDYDPRLAAAWVFWRFGHGARIAWEKRQEERNAKAAQNPD